MRKNQIQLIIVLLCMTFSVKAMPFLPSDEPARDSYIKNPMLWADVPDPDVICVDGYFYMVSTTMHFMPGTPIMRSKDLKNWETVGYVYSRLTDSPKYDLQNGTVYGRGQWATSLKYHNGKFYVLFAPNESGAMGDTYIYSADDPSKEWTLVSRMRHFHDASLFFDDDGRVYVVYGTGNMCELKPDLSGVVEGSDMKIFEREADERGLLEGSRMLKHNGRYYLLMISHVWAPGRHRRQVCYRSDNIRGPYEKQVILQSDYGGFPYVGQGTIVDSKDGDWYAVIFQDRGAVGRVPLLMPCRWIDGWPMLGDEDGHVPTWMRPIAKEEKQVSIVSSDDFNEPKLGLYWQWNHNPIDEAWSLTERKGFLRLKTNRVVSNLYEAPNTLTQRMTGPTCSASAFIDFSHLKDGDCAGMAAFNGHSGVLTISKAGKQWQLSMSEQVVSLTDREKSIKEVEQEVKETVQLTQRSVWLRIDGDFRVNQDFATFYYSYDGKEWFRIGSRYKMRFDYRKLFTGTRYALFCYSTKNRGGYVDIDNFEFGDIPQSSIPLVYEQENTGSNYSFPAMPSVSQLPVIRELPDPLTMRFEQKGNAKKGQEGQRITRFADWERRRNEIAAAIQHYGIGVKPAVAKENVKARMVKDTLVVDVTVNGETLTLKSKIQYPKTGRPPYALMIGTSGISLPRKLFDDRPIATMVFSEAQVNDYSQWRKHKERGEYNFDRLYPELKDNGAYSEWAWGLSRLIDGLQLLGEEETKIDCCHIGVTGCSYAGKMALFCGAFDERIALTIAQEPGGGGAAAWRMSHPLDSVENLEKTDYHWFLESMRENFSGDNVYRMPYDHHELVAMVCPRALLLLGNPDYKWLADEAMLPSAIAAREVWARFGIEDRMDYSIVGGHPHCQLPESQYPITQAFIDKFLLGKETEE